MELDTVFEGVCVFVPVLDAVFDPVPLCVTVCVDDQLRETVDVFVEVRVLVRVSAWCEERGKKEGNPDHPNWLAHL